MKRREGPSFLYAARYIRALITVGGLETTDCPGVALLIIRPRLTESLIKFCYRYADDNVYIYLGFLYAYSSCTLITVRMETTECVVIFQYS